MKTDLILIGGVVVLAVIAFAVGVYLRHMQEQRRRAARYSNHSDKPPSSTVCPRCRRRSYSRRDIAERYCEPCDLHYDTPAQQRRAVPATQG